MGPGAILAIKNIEGSSRKGFIVGRRIAPGSWEFRGLPVGRLTGRLSLGFFAESDPLEVALSAGVNSYGPVRFEERGWVSFDCRDEAGRRVYDAAFLNLFAAEGGRVKTSIVQLSGSVTGLRMDPESGDGKSGVINLVPGSYIITYYKAGFEPAKVEVEVKAGQLVRAAISLTPLDE